jgi:hypothetical protein
MNCWTPLLSVRPDGWSGSQDECRPRFNRFDFVREQLVPWEKTMIVPIILGFIGVLAISFLGVLTLGFKEILKSLPEAHVPTEVGREIGSNRLLLSRSDCCCNRLD